MLNSILSNLRKHQIGRQTGAVLLYMILVIVVLGIIGAAMVSMYSTSTTSTATPNFARRSKMMAESGIRYVLSELRNNANFTDTVNEINSIKTYTLADGQKFEVQVYPNFWFTSDENASSPPSNPPNPMNLIIDDEEFPGITVPPALLEINEEDIYLVREAALEYGSTSNDPTAGSDSAEIDRIESVNNSTIKVYVEDAITINAGDVIFFGSKTERNLNSFSEGDSLYLYHGARQIFPEQNGAIWVKGYDYFYDEMIEHEDHIELTNIRGTGESGEFGNIPKNRMVVINTKNNRNYGMFSKGFSGADDFVTTTLLAYNIYDDEGGGSENSERYIVDNWDPDEFSNKWDHYARVQDKTINNPDNNFDGVEGLTDDTRADLAGSISGDEGHARVRWGRGAASWELAIWVAAGSVSNPQQEGHWDWESQGSGNKKNQNNPFTVTAHFKIEWLHPNGIKLTVSDPNDLSYPTQTLLQYFNPVPDNHQRVIGNLFIINKIPTKNFTYAKQEIENLEITTDSGLDVVKDIIGEPKYNSFAILESLNDREYRNYIISQFPDSSQNLIVEGDIKYTYYGGGNNPQLHDESGVHVYFNVHDIPI